MMRTAVIYLVALACVPGCHAAETGAARARATGPVGANRFAAVGLPVEATCSEGLACDANPCTISGSALTVRA
ncbi:MAG: hypothetical protein EXR77_14500 [Myxococcales bacterium]|nr:hypothetical protein [Myxococcales bacterium]